MTNDEPQATTTDERRATSARPRAAKAVTTRARIVARIFLVALGIVFALACAEVAMRLLDKPRAAVSGWRAVYAAPAEINQIGYRGQKIEYGDQDFVILLVGDSQVEARACAFDQMPERRLEAHLNEAREANGARGRVRVFSVGASGCGQDQELLALRDYFAKYRADLVVLWETPINDLWNNVFPTSFPADGTSKPTFWLEGEALRGPSEEIGQPIRETPRLKLTLTLRKNFHWSRDRAWERRYPPAYSPITEVSHLEVVKDDWQQWYDANRRGMRDENPANEKSHLTIFLTPRSPRTTYGLDLMRALILEMQRASVAHGAGFVAFAADNPRSEEGTHSEGLHRLNGNLYRTSRAQYRANLEYFNRGFDFLPVPVRLADWMASPADPHLNQPATDQVMSDLAKRLAGRFSDRR
ncbi:MAG: hypothetical protein ABR563_07090 [Pyrinomonadaceae bacterium]